MLDADSLPFGIVLEGVSLDLELSCWMQIVCHLELCQRESNLAWGCVGGRDWAWRWAGGRERVGVGLGAGLEGERLGLELCWTAELFSMKAFYSLILFKEASSAVLARLKPVPITVNANAAVNNNAILLKPFFLLCF